MENQGQCTWQSTNKRQSRRCSQVPGHPDSGGNAVLAAGKKALCAKRPSPWDRQALQLSLSGNLMVQIYSLCPENIKPPVLGPKDLQSQKILKCPDPADCNKSWGSKIHSRTTRGLWFLKSEAAGIWGRVGNHQPSSRIFAQRQIPEGMSDWNARRVREILSCCWPIELLWGAQLQQLGIWTRTGIATDAQAHTQLTGLSMRAKDKLSESFK